MREINLTLRPWLVFFCNFLFSDIWKTIKTYTVGNFTHFLVCISISIHKDQYRYLTGSRSQVTFLSTPSIPLLGLYTKREDFTKLYKSVHGGQIPTPLIIMKSSKEVMEGTWMRMDELRCTQLSWHRKLLIMNEKLKKSVLGYGDDILGRYFSIKSNRIDHRFIIVL